MERSRVRLAAVVLLVAASQVLVLQLPLLVSAAAPRPPKTGGGSYSFATSGRAKKAMKFVKSFLKKTPWVGTAIDVVDLVMQASAGDDKGGQPPPSSPPSNGQPPVSPPSTANSSEAAESVGLYYISLDVGSPAQTLTGVVDISTQLVWMFCDLCNPVCQKSPSFELRGSTSSVVLPCTSGTCQNIFTTSGGRSCYVNEACTYYTAYGNNVFSTGYFVSDTFTSAGNSALQNMVFGCTAPNPMDTSGVSGVIGFGRGPLSLVSQLKISNFSYNLGQDGSIDLKLGNVTVPGTDGRYRVHSTRLLHSRMYPDLYYVSLTGIRVAGEDLAGIPAGTFDLRNDGTGGVSLSTTVPLTFLVEDAYNVLKKAFTSKISLTPVDTSHLGGSLDLCYAADALAGVKVPSLALVFRGEDAVVELDTANYLFNLNDGSRNLTCLTVLPSRGASMLGSLMQTGIQMIYDLHGEQLTFVSEEEAAAPATTSLATPRSKAAWLLTTVVPLVVWWSILF